VSKAINGHRYRHYKSPTMIYTVIEANALDCEDVKPMVVYRSEYETPEHPRGTIWIRSKADFESRVMLPDDIVIDRFTQID